MLSARDTKTRGEAQLDEEREERGPRGTKTRHAATPAATPLAPVELAGFALVVAFLELPQLHTFIPPLWRSWRRSPLNRRVTVLAARSRKGAVSPYFGIDRLVA